jgi:hypothetical protein
MGDYNAISNVSEFLTKLIWNNIKDDPKAKSIINSDEEISVASPKECEFGGSNKKLSIFLYNLVPAIDRSPPARVGSDGTRTPTPKGPNFEFHFLITPNTQNRINDHAILGKVIQILDENPFVKPVGSKIEYVAAMEPLSIDNLAKLWKIFDSPYKLSVSYKLIPAIRPTPSSTPSQKTAKPAPPKGKTPKK